MKKTLSIIGITAMLSVAIISQTGCAGNPEPVSNQSYYLDTICKITVYDMKDMSDEKAGKVIEETFSLCSDYEAMLSKTKEGSDIYKINHAAGKPVTCHKETIDLIKMGIKYGDLSKGKFDITIGKVTDLWDFHAENPKVPGSTSIQAALADVGYEQINIDGNKVSMAKEKGEIDLGGIAKGYIGDRLAEFMKKKGVTSAIISLGGNIVAIGDKYGDDFTIGIEKPYSEQSEVVGYTKVKNTTVVTSGIYERFFKQDGKIYHHIIDPETGYPVDSDIEGVTLVGKLGSSADCDALSTTCLLLGTKEGKALIESIDGIEAMFIDKEGEITQTRGMKFEKE